MIVVSINVWIDEKYASVLNITVWPIENDKIIISLLSAHCYSGGSGVSASGLY